MLPATLKDKLFQVQEDLSVSFRELSLNVLSRSPTPFAARPHAAGQVNLNAGADLLNHYQTSWCRMKEISESNYQLATRTDQLLKQCTSHVNSTHTSLCMLSSHLSALAVVQQQCAKISQLIADLEQKCGEVEKALEELEDLKDEEDLQRRILEDNYKVACYQDQRQIHLNSFKAKLAADHERKLHEFEAKQERISRERQQVFEQAFEEQLMQYKRVGKLPVNAKSHPSTSLEDIVVEDDTSALDDFLNEDSQVNV